MKKILLTGRPGIGKTTLIRKILPKMSGQAAGFYTQEIRRAGRRIGFEVGTLSGKKDLLAGVDVSSRFRVGKYRVNVEGFERMAVAEIERALTQDVLIIIDEIGKMELFSEKFRQVVTKALDAPQSVLATILRGNNAFVDGIKDRNDCTVVEVTEANRNQLVDRIIAWYQENQTVPFP